MATKQAKWKAKDNIEEENGNGKTLKNVHTERPIRKPSIEYALCVQFISFWLPACVRSFGRSVGRSVGLGRWMIPGHFGDSSVVRLLRGLELALCVVMPWCPLSGSLGPYVRGIVCIPSGLRFATRFMTRSAVRFGRLAGRQAVRQAGWLLMLLLFLCYFKMKQRKNR